MHPAGLLLLALGTGSAAAASRRRLPPPPPLEAVLSTLLGGALTSDEAYTELVELCDTIGHRLTGSPALEQAIDWALAEMAEDGLVTHAQPVPVRVWTRGEESLTLLSPLPRTLGVLGLGWSVGTSGGPSEGDVVVVDSFAHLQALGEAAVRDRIVLYDVPFTGYGETVAYRLRGAEEAARLGAVAVLIRSVAPEGLYTPHTGTLRHEEDAAVHQIPAAAITLEDAAWLRRLSAQGTVPRVRLSMGAQDRGTATSRNAIGEVRGRERPDEVVVLGCHIDSWDVGQGAQDDGGGCVAAMEAGRLIAALPTPPRRTVRVVLFTNEESGLAGGTAYAEAYGPRERHVAAIESDTGMGAPAGFRLHLPGEDEDSPRRLAVQAALAPARTALRTLGADGIVTGYSGADVGPLVNNHGAIGLGVDHDLSGYWLIHHTPADTVDKVDPDNVRRAVAAMAVMAYTLAELDLP